MPRLQHGYNAADKRSVRLNTLSCRTYANRKYVGKNRYLVKRSWLGGLAAGKRRTEDFLENDGPHQVIRPAEQGIRRGGRRGGRRQRRTEARRFRCEQFLFLPHEVLPTGFSGNRRASCLRLARLSASLFQPRRLLLG